MTGMLNIPSHNTDPNYRYRMPRLISKVEGRGNGIKTNVMNMADIARALKRPPEYPTKFCGTELGAQSKFDSAEGKSIVNGAHEPKDLQLLIDKFVEKYVLCPNCSLPEIDLVLKKGIVSCHCNACGHTGCLDNAHKLATFMLRNPPKGSDSTMGKQGRSKTERREKKQSKGGKESEDDEGGGAACQGVTGEKKKKKKDKSGKLSGTTKSKKRGGDDAVAGEEDDGEQADENTGVDGESGGGDENGCGRSRRNGGIVGSYSENGSRALSVADTSSVEKGSKKTSKKTAGKAKKSQGTGDQLLAKEELSYDSPEIAEVKERLIAFMRKCSEVTADGGHATASPSSSNSASSATPEDFFTELRVLQVSQDFDSVVRLFVTLDVLLAPGETGSVITADMVDEKMPYFRKVIDGSMDTAKVCQAFEDFLSLRGAQPDSIDNFPFILHKLYLAELVDEDELIARYRQTGTEDETDVVAQPSQKVSKKSAKKSACSNMCLNKAALSAVQPFIKWLQEDADDSSSGDTARGEDESENAANAAPSSLETIKGLTAVSGSSEVENAVSGGASNAAMAAGTLDMDFDDVSDDDDSDEDFDLDAI